MTVIDVDSHYEVAVTPEDHPFRHLRAEVPSALEYVAQAVSGDLLRYTPAEDAPPIKVLGSMLNPENTSSARSPLSRVAPIPHSMPSPSASALTGWIRWGSTSPL